MARREWTVWVVSNGRNEMRQYRLRRDIAMLGVAGALFVFAILGSLATKLFVRVDASVQEMRLTRANTLLRSELKNLRQRMEQLDGSLAELAENDETYRLLAGLEPIDADVRRVGIGGPGMETLETNPLWDVDREAAVRSFEASVRVDELLRRARLLSFSWREATETLSEAHDRLAATPSILPTDGDITSGFTNSRLHPILGIARPHFGLDVVAATGTPIVAAARGRISFVGRRGDFGLMIEIDHGYGVVTRYAHASKTRVRLGQHVERGDTIGNVGRTGLAVAPHLHYEVLVEGRPANPRRYLFTADAIPD